jgi:hypothetical protein
MPLLGIYIPTQHQQQKIHKNFPSLSSKNVDQGDQIGRIFACWALFILGSFLL